MRRLWPWGLAAVSAVGALVPLLSLPVAFLLLLGWLSVGSLGDRGQRRARALLGISSAVTFFGLCRFVVVEAMPGIVRGGRQALERRAVSRLRDVRVAQDAVRRAGWIDPDADGRGSAARIDELCSGASARGPASSVRPWLECGAPVPSPLGAAVEQGAYRMLVCLPVATGWSARKDAPVDEERAERLYVAYAWPSPAGRGGRAFFIDQDDRIGEAAWPPDAYDAGGRLSERSGLDCEAALSDAGFLHFSPWKGKGPREAEPAR